MKRTNLFLAATTGLLALASFAFAKSNAHKSSFTGYCLTSGGAQCPTIAGRFNSSATILTAAKCLPAVHPSKVNATVVTVNCANFLKAHE